MASATDDVRSLMSGCSWMGLCGLAAMMPARPTPSADPLSTALSSAFARRIAASFAGSQSASTAPRATLSTSSRSTENGTRSSMTGRTTRVRPRTPSTSVPDSFTRPVVSEENS